MFQVLYPLHWYQNMSSRGVTTMNRMNSSPRLLILYQVNDVFLQFVLDAIWPLGCYILMFTLNVWNIFLKVSLRHKQHWNISCNHCLNSYWPRFAFVESIVYSSYYSTPIFCTYRCYIYLRMNTAQLVGWVNC